MSKSGAPRQQKKKEAMSRVDWMGGNISKILIQQRINIENIRESKTATKSSQKWAKDLKRHFSNKYERLANNSSHE